VALTRIGLVGCGSIGTELALAVQGRFHKNGKLIGLADQFLPSAQSLSRKLNPSVPVLSIAQLVRKSDLIIEAASAEALKELLPHLIRHKRPVLILSSAGLLIHPTLYRKAVRAGVPIHLPSGAVVGLDGLKAACIDQLHSVVLTTRKPPAALGHTGPPLKKAKTVFSGTPSAAAKAFPRNINIAATVAIVGQASKTRVRIIADPAAKRNTHTLAVRGAFGTFTTEIQNRPFPKNPKTSRLAADSAIVTLGEILKPGWLGT